MGTNDSIFKDMYEAVLEGNIEKARTAAEKGLESGIPPLTSIEDGLSPGIQEVGARFGRMEMYLPEMVLSTKAMEAAVEVLEPYMGEEAREKKGTVLIGTVKGDIHDIGKNIAISLLRVNGYEVIDLGKDISSEDFVDEAEKIGARVIGLSGLLTTSLPMMREVIEIMDEYGVREDYKVVIGGGPTSQDFADSIGADAYASTAQDGVEFCDHVFSVKA